MPFDDSRRLTGINLYFNGTGVALETIGIEVDGGLIEAWTSRVTRMRAALGWPHGDIVARRHAKGASLAFAAPPDQLYAATEVNEWAWLSALASLSLRERVPAGRVREIPSVSSTSSSRGQKLPSDESMLAFARSLRQTSTDAEQRVWFLLRDRRMHGRKFRRQYAVSPYVLDFYCDELKLAIELDGGQHADDEQVAHDVARDAFLHDRGIRVLRYWNDDVLQRTEDVANDMWRFIDTVMRGEEPAPRVVPSSALRAPSPEGRRDRHAINAQNGSRAVLSPEETRIIFFAPGHAAVGDEESARHTLAALARAERRDDVVALVEAAKAHGVVALLDDDALSLGAGAGSRTFALDALPTPDTVDWAALHDIPLALVTGSNGKTTTTRLLAAMLRAHGWRTAYTSTDGVVVGQTLIEVGDFSGPGGARVALREREVDAAILETARGGMLRRGLAVARADVAVVTNVSADHFGEYGIHTLDDLADVKLVVARALDANGVLVVNADDERLAAHAAKLGKRSAWFAFDADAPLLCAAREQGGTTCGGRDDRLLLSRDGVDHDLGAIAAMPLTFAGAARYNVANIAAAALAACAFDIAPATIRAVLATFGSARDDNPGRLQHWSVGDVDVYVDYAHNPDGLRGLLGVATRDRGRARLGIVLGQAGNREDTDVRELAAVAASFNPDRVVLKDIPGFLRGREEGEIAAILRDELVRRGLANDRIVDCLDEYQAAVQLFEWARPGDTVVLPIHGSDSKRQLDVWLGSLAR